MPDLAVLTQPLRVEKCIGCGARVRFVECPEGCDDVPLDLVELVDVEAVEAVIENLDERLAALRGVAEALAGEGEHDLDELRRRARHALRLTVPSEPAAEVEIVEAWGCPRCGRVDAPQPCIGVCVRQPTLMVGVDRLRELTGLAAERQADDARLSAVVAMAATVTPRPGHVEQTREALRARARAALAASGERQPA